MERWTQANQRCDCLENLGEWWGGVLCLPEEPLPQEFEPISVATLVDSAAILAVGQKSSFRNGIETDDCRIEFEQKCVISPELFTRSKSKGYISISKNETGDARGIHTLS